MGTGTKKRIVGWCAAAVSSLLLLIATAGDAASSPLIAAGGVCSASGQEVDNGCPGCFSSTVSINCEPIEGDCEGCSYTYFAILNCGTPIVWAGSSDLECDAKFERRFGGCGVTGSAWGGVVCDCAECPPD